MTSRDQFEAWAAEHLPALYLTKTDQGTYESTATGNFYAVWSARDGEIERLKANHNDLVLRNKALRERPDLPVERLSCVSMIEALQSDREQLKATVADYEMGLEAAKEEIARVKADLAAELQRRWDGNEASAREHDEEVRKLKAENEALRKALTDIFNHIEGNTDCLVRDLVNWGTPRINPNDFYDECEAIKEIASAAMSKEASDE